MPDAHRPRTGRVVPRRVPSLSRRPRTPAPAHRPRRPARGRTPDPPCRNPARRARVRRAAPATSRRAVRRLPARSAACVGRRRRFRGRDPSRPWRVSRDRRPLVARVAAEHGLADWRGRSRCPTVGIFPDSSRYYVELREARAFAVSGLSARLHITTHARYWRAISSLEWPSSAAMVSRAAVSSRTFSALSVWRGGPPAAGAFQPVRSS